MSAPIRWIHHNIIFGNDGAWAVYRLAMTSYGALSASGKRRLLSDLAALACVLDADFSLLRVARGLSARRLRERAELVFDDEHGLRDPWKSYLDHQERALRRMALHRLEAYLSVSLRDAPAGDQRSLRERFAGWQGGLLAALGLSHPAWLSQRQLSALAEREARTLVRIVDCVRARPATSRELQWLIRHAFCRGLAEPALDEQWSPQMAIRLVGDGLRYEPSHADLLRLQRWPIEVRPRSLRVVAEDGDSYQAACAVGALPEQVTFPGSGAELLFAPLESLRFPVDAAFSARRVANDAALRLVRRRVVDADNELAEQRHGDHGPDPDALLRPDAARELERRLRSQARPPLLRSTISLLVGAASEDELAARLDALRRAYGAVRLELPAGEQLALWRQHLPGQPTQLRAYEDHLLPEQFGALVPIATRAVGADRGPYLGHTVGGSRHPVCWDLTEPCRRGLTPATLLVGPPGRGKTAALQRLCYEGFLRGSRVIDIDPKPDHRWSALPAVREHVETIVLSADARFRGVLDPLRVAPPEEAEDLAVDWLLSLLRPDIPHAWETEVRAAVKGVVGAAASAPQDAGRAARPGCGEVLQTLRTGNVDAVAVGRALEVFADSGIAQLGIAAPRSALLRPATRRVIQLRIAGLALPEQVADPRLLASKERIGQALLQLVAAYALGLMAAGEGRRHTVLGFDEAWVLMTTPGGRRLLSRANRLGRAQNGTPLLGTQSVGDIDEQTRELVGAVFAFGAETDQEARRLLALLGLDSDDAELREQLIDCRAGRCLLRDYSRRVAHVQIDFGADPGLLAALDTTPGRGAG